MGVQCSQTQNSMVIFQSLHSFDEKEQQNHHQASQTLKYSFPQKQILEMNKTKLQLQQEQNHPQQPEDPGSPMQALSEQSFEICELTQFNNSCPTTIRISRQYPNEFTIQPNKTLSIKKINFSPSKQNKPYNQKQKGIIKKSRYSDSQSPNSSQTIKSVRFLITEQVRPERKLIRSKSLSRRQSSKRLNQSTIYSNRDQSFYYKIEFLIFKDEHNGCLVKLYHFKTISHAIVPNKFNYIKQYFHKHSPILVSAREEENEFSCNNDLEEMTGRTRSKTQGTKNTLKPNKHYDLTEQLDLAIKPKGLLKNRCNKETQSQKRVSFSIPSRCTLEYRQIVQTAINKYQVKQKQ
ncbi:unnamed protein product [Paramecium pentaurelia]|uniref:Uncharacterized protein n=1 Tax=Paramecium pentaurelia TaxID=43138 RepID=A0A8S1W1Q6_9CILI|nr:unnamed protein product [Paramecium pentaurelia]